MPVEVIITLGIILAIIFLIIITNVKVVPQATTKIIERFGAYHKTLLYPLFLQENHLWAYRH